MGADYSFELISIGHNNLFLGEVMSFDEQNRKYCQRSFNTSYLTDSYIVFTLNMESVTKSIIFGLKMMVKSGLEKFILKSLHAGRWLFSPSFLGQN